MVVPDTFAVAFLIQRTGDTPSSSLQNLIDSSKDLIKNLTSDNSLNVTEIEQSIVTLLKQTIYSMLDQHTEELLQNGLHVNLSAHHPHKERRKQEPDTLQHLPFAHRPERHVPPVRDLNRAATRRQTQTNRISNPGSSQETAHYAEIIEIGDCGPAEPVLSGYGYQCP